MMKLEARLILLACEVCLVALLIIQDPRKNAAQAYIFPEINFPLTSSSFNLRYLSLLYFNMSDIKSFKLPRLDDLKPIILVVDELSSRLYKNINSFIQNPGHLLFHLHNFSWNWAQWHPYISCSEINYYDIGSHFKNELFGQHIVAWSLPKLLNYHLTKNKPTKALLLSFQGPTGCGKSFVSKMIHQSLFNDSKFVYTYYGSRDFFHESEKEKYRERLLHEIPFLLGLCDRSVFIFEEMDKMVPGVIDVILPFIYFYKNSTDTNGAKSIFIFISNSGAKIIEEIMYDAWLKGVPREDMTLTNFTSYLKKAAYNEPGGLQYSEIIKENLIDMFLPFLPLEREQVKQCILKEFNLRKMPLNKDAIEYVADQIIYHPTEFELFAESGCKRIPHKVDLYGDSDL